MSGADGAYFRKRDGKLDGPMIDGGDGGSRLVPGGDVQVRMPLRSDETPRSARSGKQCNKT